VITTNCTAMTENTFIGVCTEPGDISLSVHNLNSWSNPSIDNIIDALEKVYSGNHIKKDIPFERYDMENIFNDWKKFLEI
jgi:hypothetical protein